MLRSVIIIFIIMCAVAVQFYLNKRNIGAIRREFIDRPRESNDYIVVGAGSADAVVANRLSENGDVTVILIEAGGDDRDIPEISTPARAMAIQNIADVVNIYIQSMTRRNLKILKYETLCVLGGSSSINYMNYVRGSRHDFDRWANYTGDPTWDYANVLPYFKKSEKMTDPTVGQSEYHNDKGPLGVSQIKDTHTLSKNIIEGFKELGIPFNKDYNGESMEGVSLVQMTIENGVRSSTARAFLHPVLDRPNLDVMVNAYVQKVVIKDKKAEGVEVIFKGRKFLIKSNKETILSAGAIQSPQILMLSGVGPKKHLEEMGIPLIADLPVGQNLQDHVFSELDSRVNEGAVPSHSQLESNWANIKYKLFQSGPLPSFGIEVMAFTSISDEKKTTDWPELQFILLPVCLSALHIPNCWTCVTYATRPASRGHLRLRSIDPFDDPVIFPNYFKEQADADTNYEGIRICQKLSRTKSLMQIGSNPLQHQTICKQYEFDTKDYWMCVMRSRPETVFHPSGTCKMGPPGDQTGVVDSKLRVLGVKGLRVADASVMPYIVSGNTNAPVIMIGEKVADFIKHET